MSLTSVQKKENNIIEMEIAVSAEALREATDLVFKKRAKEIAVPGFRKGKAPRKIIEKMYGEDVFTEDAVNEIFPQYYSEAVDESGYVPVDRANVEMLNIDRETGFTFKATVTVKPEVSVSDYKGLEAEKVLYKAKDSDVDAELERMRERGARLITVEDRPAKEGDDVVIDYEGFMDGVPFDGGKADGHKLTLGSHSFIDTFEDQIAGHNPGDEFEVNVTFPEEYHAEELKGKPAVFKVKLTEISERELPELDDEFAKDVSEFDTLAELRADMFKNLQESQDKRADEELEGKLIDQVCEKLEGDIPEIMYENKIDDMSRDFENRLLSQGMTLDNYLSWFGMDTATFRENFREQAQRQVKISLALEKIAQLENIEVTDDDIAKEYEKLADMYKLDVDQIKSFVNEQDLISDIKNIKAMDLIKDSAKITETEEKEEKEEESKPEDTKAEK